MTESVAQRDPVEQLAEEFMARLRRGEHPVLSDYTAAHPALADEIRDLFPALVMMEQIKPAGTEPDSAAAGPDAPPEQLGDYRILREVARGGMGVVYEAEQVALGRHVALKVLPARSGGCPLRLLRFRREARSTARLHHTNIVPVFDVGSADGVHYYAMQFIQGQGLDEVLQELRRLRSGAKPTDAPAADLTASLADGLRTGVFVAAPIVPVPKPAAPQSEASAILTGPASHYLRSVARLGVQAAEALAYAHGQRVLHRDVKPSNLLLDRQGTLWLTDFGLAKDDTEDLTRTGDIIGTIRYMAPERFQGVADPRSDVYALGVTLYEMLTLRPAFPEQDRVLLIKQIAKDDPPKPRAIDPTLPRDLETIVLKAIAKEPDRRYPTAADMAEDLRRFLADRPIKARRASWREQGWRWCRRNPGVALSLSAAFAILVVGTVCSTWLAVRAKQAEELAGRRLVTEVEANREAHRRLFEARWAEARASQYSRQSGRRFNGLDALAEAAQLARELEMGEDVRARLRDDAIACLALADVRSVKDWEGWPAGSTTGLGFDADLEHYARSDTKGNVSVLRVADDARLALLPGDGPGGGSSGAADIRFSPDGRLLAVHSWDRLPPGKGNFRVWDWRSGTVVFEPPFPVGTGEVAFSPDGRQLALHEPGDVLCLLDTSTMRAVWRAEAGCPISGVAFHPDGSRIAFASPARKQVQLRRSETGELVGAFPAPQGCDAPVWHPAGAHLLVAGTNRSTHLYDPARPSDTLALRGHQNDGVRASCDPGSDLVLSWSWDGNNRLWDPWRGRELLRFEGADGWFSRDGRRLATRVGRRLHIWEFSAGGEYRTLPRARGASRTTFGDISPDGRLLAAATSQGVCLWDLPTGRAVAVLDISTVGDVKFHPSGRELFTGGPAGVYAGVYAWAVRPGPDGVTVGPARRVAGPAGRMSLDAGGRRLALTGGDAVRLLDLRDSSLAVPRPGYARTRNTSLSPDGRWVAAGTQHGFGVRVWDAATGEAASEPLLPDHRDTAVSFAPSGAWLVVGTPEGYHQCYAQLSLRLNLGLVCLDATLDGSVCSFLLRGVLVRSG